MLTPEQRERRRQGIGGSDVAAICGKNPYKSALDVYFEKVLDDIPEISNDDIWWGNKNEAGIIEFYEKTYNQTMSFPDTKVDKDYPCMLANVDGILEDGAVFEAKNVGHRAANNIKEGHRWGPSFSIEVPHVYCFQIMHYMRIFDAPYGKIGAYFGGSEYRIYEFDRDKAFEEMILKKCTNFWENHVLKRIPPSATCYKDQVKLWKDAFADKKKEAPTEVTLALQDYNRIQQNIKELEKESESLKSIICGFMQDSEILTDTSGKTLVTWKNQKTCRFDLPRFKSEQADLYKQNIVEKTSRVLRINGEI